MYYTDIDEDDLDGLPSILTPAMAADTLCVHVNTIYNLLRSGKMTGFRMGAAWRIRKKRPAGIFAAGREFDFLSKKLYAVLMPAYSFSFVWFYASTLPSL